MNALRSALALLMAIAAGSAAHAATAEPLGGSAAGVFHYQATLTDETGEPLNGHHEVFVNIYDAPAGGNLLWGPWPTPAEATVPVHNGRLELAIGPTDTTDDTPAHLAFTGDEAHIELTVDGDAILPRQAVRSAPLALTEQLTEFGRTDFGFANFQGPMTQSIATATTRGARHPVLVVINASEASQNALSAGDVGHNIIFRLLRTNGEGETTIREWTVETTSSFGSVSHPVSLVHVDADPGEAGETVTYEFEVELTQAVNFGLGAGDITLVTLDQTPEVMP